MGRIIRNLTRTSFKSDVHINHHVFLNYLTIRSRTKNPNNVRSLTNKTTIIEDNNYKGLYYHPTRDKTDYFLSFLADNDKINKFFDITVIGSIPFKSEVADNNIPQIIPHNFNENKKFTQILHQVIAENVYSDVQLQALAKYHQNGWLHVADARDPAPWGRIPYPEDIFGMIQVIDGKIVHGSYQPMPTHRIVTAKGLFVLNDPLQEKLLEKMKKLCI
ncbi:12194_t:CDS:2 [Funneliformis geosporum]|uniref:11284_t:CDS:1 n=1 Tax=Funneliformis geosporum TaxID=1117311 RepID=A0A9W4SN16_9GLOM|nr:12194_t:CDS:2 [Funneliformis geosporum]CAI2175372.1 11284_t:CDS:2 [Funneliformis geosporum]